MTSAHRTADLPERRVAIVTGASRGIGAGSARALVASAVALLIGGPLALRAHTPQQLVNQTRIGAP